MDPHICISLSGSLLNTQSYTWIIPCPTGSFLQSLSWPAAVAVYLRAAVPAPDSADSFREEIKYYIPPFRYVTCKGGGFFFSVTIAVFYIFRAVTEAELKAEEMFLNTEREVYASSKGLQPSKPLCMHHAQILGGG